MKKSFRQTIIVGPANLWMVQFHERMPVILERSDLTPGQLAIIPLAGNAAIEGA